MRDADVPVGAAGADPAAPTLLTTEREITSPPSSPSLRSSSKSSGCFLDDGAHPQRFPYSTLHSTFCIPVPFPIPYPKRDPISLQPAFPFHTSSEHCLSVLGLGMSGPGQSRVSPLRSTPGA